MTVSALVLMPVVAIAQDSTPPAEASVNVPAEQPAPEPSPIVEAPPVVDAPPVVVEPPVQETPVTEPPDVPVLAEQIPTVAQEPSDAVPTPEMAPTEITAPTATVVAPTPTERIWVNTDTVALNSGAAALSLGPGESRTITLVYTVTTPRTSTTVSADLAGATDGWRIDSAGLPDANPAASQTTWTNVSAMTPGTLFEIPFTIVAPSILYSDQSVMLRVWSGAEGTSGPETGIAPSSPFAITLTATAPVNTDTALVEGAPVATLGSAEQAIMTVVYNVTTYRTGTALRAYIADESGNVAEGWTVTAVATGTESVTDSGALVPGSTFRQAFTVTSPAYVHADQAVTLRLSSTATNPLGVTPVLDGHIIATFDADATPAAPTLACDTVDSQINCKLDADRSDVTSATISISAPAGWSFVVNGQSVTSDASLTLGADGTVPESFTITPSYDGGCPDADASLAASMRMPISYANVDAVSLETALELPAPVFSPMPPLVSIDPVQFGEIRWNGDAWETVNASTIATIRQEGCGIAGAYDVQVQVLGAAPGVQPVIVGTSSGYEGISGSASPVDPNGAPVTVAHIESGFSGTGTLTIHFALSPTSDAVPGTHTMTIGIAVVNGQ
jgi:hypothetical protein